ncbi:MAG: hypothetical protein KIT70_00280 [Anaerolineales bacterium]|nr:MAG: hypothetical protein KIT70_00280 [Anaerolineales bacterium]
MLNLSLLLTHSLVGILAISGIILTVGLKRPRWFLEKKNVPPDILAAVPPRTAAERRQSLWAAIPLAFGLLGLVFYSTYVFGSASGAGFGLLFLHALILILTVSTFDLVVIDWLLLKHHHAQAVCVPRHRRLRRLQGLQLPWTGAPAGAARPGHLCCHGSRHRAVAAGLKNAPYGAVFFYRPAYCQFRIAAEEILNA